MSFIVKKHFCVNCFFAGEFRMSLGVPESDFAFQGHGNVISRFKLAAASDGVQWVRDVEEQQRL
jgi:hypothetical protein